MSPQSCYWPESTREHTCGQSHWWGHCAFSPSPFPVVSLRLMSNLIWALLVFGCANSRTEGKLNVIGNGSVCPTREITWCLWCFPWACGGLRLQGRAVLILWEAYWWSLSFLPFDVIWFLMIAQLCFLSVWCTQQFLETKQCLSFFMS